MSVESEFARLGALIRQLQGALGGNRIIRGSVDSAGAVSLGSGFTAVRNATGDYTVTFTTPFSGIPSIVVGGGVTAATAAAKLKNGVAPTASAFSVYTFATATGALIDFAFEFIAAGP